MDNVRVVIGLFAFCIGLVVWINLNALLGFSYPAPVSFITIKIILAILIFGGIALIVIGYNSDKGKQKSGKKTT